MFDDIKAQLENLPEFLTSRDLVKLGLFSSVNSLYAARQQGRGPDFVKYQKKVLYARSSVLKFLESRIRDGSVPRKSDNQPR